MLRFGYDNELTIRKLRDTTVIIEVAGCSEYVDMHEARKLAEVLLRFADTGKLE